MQFRERLDLLSIFVVFMACAIGALLAFECGYRVGRWWQNRTPEEREGPTAMIVASLLALLAFMLAITMGMASDRFEARRGIVLAEANALGTTYLRAGYLPEPASGEIRELLRAYIPLRIVGDDVPEAEMRTRISRSVELHGKLWSIAEELAREAPESQVVALFIESLNESIDLHQSRVTAGIYGRVPETVLILLLLCSTLTLGMVGYNAGLTRRRSPLAAFVMMLVLSAVLTLVVDLDRPREGFLTVSQQPMIELNEQINTPRQANAPNS